MPGNLAAAAAAAYATQNNANLTYRLITWPDAHSMQTKIDLAKRLGVRGISIFKFDGGQDPAIWNTLAGVASANTVPAAKPAQSSAVQPATPGTGGTTSGSFTRGLDLRATGADVLRLQRFLNTDADTRVAASGAGSPGNETSYFGPATKGAVQKFQVKYGIAGAGDPGYGYVGPKTRAKLNSLSN
jgi:peptidoglycan hydrolase-like protein with peptidoglycan-binding domain